MNEEQEARRKAIKEYSDKLGNSNKNLQYISTSFELVDEILSKLKEYTDFNNKTFCVFNLEFLESLCYDYKVNGDMIFFVTDSPEKAKIAKSMYGVTIAEDTEENNLNLFLNWETDMKFDVVVGNPPYQTPSKGGNGQRDLWPKFVEKSFDIVKEDGYVTLVHPAKWRRTEEKLWERLSQKQIKYLEIHNDQDGRKTFGAVTRYDWYVIQNSKCSSKSIVVDENGKTHSINLSELPCLPNYNFEAFWNVVAKDNEKTLDIIYSASLYDVRKPYMSKEKSDKFQYPCVYGMYQDGTISEFYSSEKSNHFVSKVILGIGRYAYPLIDIEGKYGLTQNAFGIKVSSLKEAENIKKAIESDKFKEIIKATKWGNFQTDWRMFKYFKKDFWKDFV
jgi:hypothetical protein